MMRRFISASIIFSMKTLSTVFYRCEVSWVKEGKENTKINWGDVRLVVFINHTSLYEILYLAAFPFGFLWKCSKHVLLPGADKTMNRRLTGRFFKYLTPNTVSITRKKDDTWEAFLDQIDENTITAIFPEGRMMRPNGLDLNGQPMSIRGGISDILHKINDGQMLIAYMGGMHHVQVPGQKIPNLFKRIKIRYEVQNITEYKKQFDLSDLKKFKHDLMADLESRKAKHCPSPQT